VRTGARTTVPGVAKAEISRNRVGVLNEF